MSSCGIEHTDQNGAKMVRNWCGEQIKVPENAQNKGDLKQMKLGIVVHAPFFYKSIYPYKTL